MGAGQPLQTPFLRCHRSILLKPHPVRVDVLKFVHKILRNRLSEGVYHALTHRALAYHAFGSVSTDLLLWLPVNHFIQKLMFDIF
jgi:hypothetical protein